jgi:hypothetical protein
MQQFKYTHLSNEKKGRFIAVGAHASYGLFRSTPSKSKNSDAIFMAIIYSVFRSDFRLIVAFTRHHRQDNGYNSYFDIPCFPSSQYCLLMQFCPHRCLYYEIYPDSIATAASRCI